MDNNWFIEFNQNFQENKKINLYVMHHAGGAAQFFKPLATKLPSWINLVAVQLPGRWNRIREKPYLNIDPLIKDFGPIFQNHIQQQNVQFVLFGHSLGGLIAFELSRYLQRNNHPLPKHLFISSKRAPQIPSQTQLLFNLPDHEFEMALTLMYGALPAEVSADPEFKKMFMDITKTDMNILDTYNFTADATIPLPIPMTVMRGANDHIITKDSLAGWQAMTSQEYQQLDFPGDHFFIRNQAEDAISDLISSKLKLYTRK